MASGFTWAGSTDESEPIYSEPIPVKNTVVLSKGEMCNLESGEADAGAAADTALLGPAASDVDNTSDGEYVRCILNPNAIYAVEDNNLRTMGDIIDLASGGMGVTTDSSHTFQVWRTKKVASEPTLVIYNGTHFTQT